MLFLSCTVWGNSSLACFVSRIVWFRIRPKSQRRRIRRRNFENSRGELSSRRLVSSQRYLSPEQTMGHGHPELSRSSPDVISFPTFASSPLIPASCVSCALRQEAREGWKRQRIANHESHEIASSAASQRQTRPMLKKPLSAHYRL